MNKKETIKRIYEILTQCGTLTSKPDVLGTYPVEDEVYTKRLDVNKTIGEGPDTIDIVCVTLSSSDEEFGNSSPSDIRLNTKNTNDQWCNLFITDATDEMLSLVQSALNNKYQI